MSLTVLGGILIPLAVVTSLVAPRWLYILMIFFVPFSATVVANFGSGSSFSGLQVYMLMGAVWISRKGFNALAAGHVRLPREQARPFLLFAVFLAVAVSSLIMPVVIDGGLLVLKGELGQRRVVPLTFSMKHVTQTVYLLYGCLFALLVAAYNRRPERFGLSIKVYVLSGIFVSLWGWLQFLSYELGFPYPSVIFNNSLSIYAEGYLQTFVSSGDVLKRVSSVAVEPSIFAQYVLTVVPFALFSVLFRRPIISPAVDRLALVVMLSILLLSTSATAYLGLVFMAAATLVSLFFFRALRLRFLVAGLAVISLALVAYLTIGPIRDLIERTIFEKAESYSGLSRLSAFERGWEHFLDYPVLGIGWGSVTTHDTVIFLLANTGIAGLVSFAALMLLVLARVVNIGGRNGAFDRNTVFWAGSLTVSLVTLLFTSVISGFPFVFGHFWFILGMAIACPSAVLLLKTKSLAIDAKTRVRSSARQVRPTSAGR